MKKTQKLCCQPNSNCEVAKCSKTIQVIARMASTGVCGCMWRMAVICTCVCVPYTLVPYHTSIFSHNHKTPCTILYFLLIHLKYNDNSFESLRYHLYWKDNIHRLIHLLQSMILLWPDILFTWCVSLLFVIQIDSYWCETGSLREDRVKYAINRNILEFSKLSTLVDESIGKYH